MNIYIPDWIFILLIGSIALVLYAWAMVIIYEFTRQYFYEKELKRLTTKNRSKK